MENELVVDLLSMECSRIAVNLASLWQEPPPPPPHDGGGGCDHG